MAPKILLRVLACAVSVAGIGLIVLSQWPQRSQSPALNEGATRTISKNESFETFTAQLHALSHSDETQITAFWKSVDRLVGLSDVELQGQVRRVLSTGDRIEAKLVMKIHHDGNSFNAKVRVQRESDVRDYDAEGQAGQLKSVTIIDGTPGSVPIHIDSQSLKAVGNSSLGVGDAQLGDVLFLLQSFQEKNWKPLGTLDDADSRRLIAFSVQAKNAAALVYLDVATLRVTTVRVFDERRQLIRVYGNLSSVQFAGTNHQLHFFVRSLETQSESVYELISLLAK